MTDARDRVRRLPRQALGLGSCTEYRPHLRTLARTPPAPPALLALIQLHAADLIVLGQERMVHIWTGFDLRPADALDRTLPAKEDGDFCGCLHTLSPSGEA